MKSESSFLLLSIAITLIWAAAGSATAYRIEASAPTQEDSAVTRLREYLRLKAVHPNPDYKSSIEFIKKQAEEIGLEYNIKEMEAPALFAIWLTWRGTDQALESILLNSHIDVVPVDESKWTHDPFGADKDENGNIYARGTQDMKGQAIQYLEAVRNLMAKGVKPLRNVHISFVPDEEMGGGKGMKPFVKTAEFKSLNVGFALDEGSTTVDGRFSVVWAERAAWWVEFVAEGQSGHGSILHNNTAAEKIRKVIDAMLDMRTREKKRMEDNGLTLGEVTSINLDILKGGQQANVMPAELSATFDIRITPSWNFTYVEEFLEEVRSSAGPQVSIRFSQKSEVVAVTPLVSSNVWWTTFQSVAKEEGWELVPAISSGATDARFIRELGIPAFGFVATRNTPKRAHDHDEFVNEISFLNGIKVYERLLPRLFNLNNFNLI